MSPFMISALKAIWKKMSRKGYRDSFVSAQISGTVAAQIAMLRDKKGWTQTELANRAGMRQSRISSLEDPNYENIEVGTLRRIASAFDVALIVRFAPFSELARETVTSNSAGINVTSFDEDALLCPDEDTWTPTIQVRKTSTGAADEAFGGLEKLGPSAISIQ